MNLYAAFRLLPFLLPLLAMAAPAAFPPTAPDVTELKTLPPGLLVRSEAKGDYFEQNGALFRPLFRYIQQREIAMTTPVEAHMGETSSMYFWVGESERTKAEPDLATSTGAGVAVMVRPARLVVSHGGRGGYSRENFARARSAAQTWLADRSELVADGDAYAVYWNGPFVPGFLKRYEVHIPVRRLAAGSLVASPAQDSGRSAE